MIIIDVETTGLDPVKNSILSLGAIDLYSDDRFYMECRVEPGTENDINSIALGVNGFTIEQAKDISKPYPKDVYREFLKFAQNKQKLLGGQQVGSFDILFLKHIATKYNFEWPFGHRSVDLHSVMFAKTGKTLSLDGILQELKMNPEPKPHNALTGAKLEKEAFLLLLK